MATKNVLSAELTEKELEKINSLTSNMLLCVLKKFDLLNEDIPDRRTCPSSKAEWTDLLLHILFNGCAMTFQAADSWLMTRSSHRKGKFLGHQCQKYYMGSLSDGLGCAIPGRFSDTDIMNVLDGYIATQGQTADTSLEKNEELETNTSSHTNTKKIYLNQGSFPCYTKLKQDDSSAKLIEIAKSLNYGPVIRSETREELLAHTFEFDNSIAVQCDTWPQESLPWLNRHRLAQWPTSQMIESCSELPVYIVSKAHASNADDKLEWRYSFGRQEVLLLREISIMMKMTYIVTKFLVKQVIMSDDSLSTYHLKTLMLWFCEKKSVRDFDGKSLYENVLEFFDFVLHNLDRGAIHHYFIPENNLVAHLLDSTVCDIKATLFNLRDNILGCLANSHLVKKYPFEICTLAKLIEENPELNAMTFKKCQSICLDIVMEYVVQSHLPHFRCAFTCARYVLPQDINCQIFTICQSLLKKSSAKTSMMADKIFGKSYKSLFLLTLTLYEELRADIPLLTKMTLTEYIDTEEKNLQLECSIADTFRVTCIHSTAKTTRILCLVIYEIAKKNKIERSIVTQVLRNLASTISFVENGHQYLLYRFKEIATLLQVPDSGIEVVFATLVRLWNATDLAIGLLETISSLFDGVSMDAVLKHLVFALFLYAENETIPDEITSQWKLMKTILKSGTIPNAINVFLFVAATCIFTKFVNNLKGEVKVFHERLLSFKLGKLHNNIQELGDTLTELLESETLDLEKLFHVQCCYAMDCMKTTGVSFVVSVMDDLLEPHHNLGVLAAVGIELTATEDIDKALQVLELWTHRYIQANIEQNPDLIVKIFGKLGHLYHIKSNVVSRRRSVYVRKADIMFQTALKENNPDIAVMIDYIIFVKQNFPKMLSSSIDKALECIDAMKISVYFKNSEPIFESEELREFQDMLNTNGMIKVSSSVLAYYFYIMLSLEKSLPRQTCTTPIQKMEELIQVMEATIEEMQENGEDCENQKTVLEGQATLSTINSVEEESKEPSNIEVPNISAELESFFVTKEPQTSKTPQLDVSVDDFNDLFLNASDMLETARKAKPKRRYAAKSRNPLKTMSASIEVRSEYTEVITGVADKELKRVKTAQISQNAGFAVEALAGLASKENFSKVELRKTDSFGAGSPCGVYRLEPYLPLMLIHIKGRRRVQCRLVEPCAESINSGDCFALITTDKIIQWHGEFCNVIEKAKAADFCDFVKQKRDLGCKKAHDVMIVEENQRSPGTRHFWELLGGQKPYMAGGSTEEDELYENHITETNMIYKLDQNKLIAVNECWGAQPKYEMLNPYQVFVFDFGSEVYVWQGKSVSPTQRKISVKLAQQVWKRGYDYSQCDINPVSPLRGEGDGGIPGKSEKRPDWALLGKVNQNMETILFREKFADWPDTSRLIKVKSQEEVDTKKVDLADLKAYDAKLMVPIDTAPVSLMLEGSNVGRGNTWAQDMDGFIQDQIIETIKVRIWHVLEYDHYEIEDHSYGQFHEGDTYVIRWQYMITNAGMRNLKGQQSRYSTRGRERCAYFFWQGKTSTVNEKGASALMTVELDEERGPQIRVSEGKEMACFLNCFKGRMIIHIGKREEEETNTPGPWKMYCLRNEFDNEMCLIEVNLEISNLRSVSSCLLLNVQTGQLTVWHGCKSPEHTQTLARKAADNLKERCPLEVGLTKEAIVDISEVHEGKEMTQFWRAMDVHSGDRSEYHSLIDNRESFNHTLRLFHMTSVSGLFEVHEILNPSRTPDLPTKFPVLQTDLYKASQPAVFLIDNGHEVFLWQGWWPEGDEDQENVHTGSAQTRFTVDRRCAMETTIQYCKEINPDSPPPAFMVYAGLEPLSFTNLFPFWTVEEDAKDINIRDGRAEGELVSVEDLLKKLMKTRYTFAELTDSTPPEGVDPLKLETYLSDEEFEEVLHMTREAYDSLPNWKKTKYKQEARLF